MFHRNILIFGKYNIARAADPGKSIELKAIPIPGNLQSKFIGLFWFRRNKIFRHATCKNLKNKQIVYIPDRTLLGIIHE